jgi:polyphosphate kinase 2 (PPK2 family)
MFQDKVSWLNMDMAGKDGVIRKVFEGIHPQGVQVASFKLPTPIEHDHDYLWRAHQRVPTNGEMTIFNRSYYEDVLAVRVHDLVPSKVWQRRYAQINHFESTFVEEGLTVLKFFATVLVETLRGLKMRYPAPQAGLAEVVIH